MLQYHSCGVSFIIRFYLIPLIRDQMVKKNSCKILQKDECSHRVLNRVYLQKNLKIGVIFRDESNEPISILIGYSDATVNTPNHPLIVRPKISLARVTATVL